MWIGLGTLPACSDDTPFVGTVYRSEYFEYHSETDEPLCPTLLSTLDEHARVIGSVLGLHPSKNDSPFRYFRFRDEESLRRNGTCGDDPACVTAGSGTVYSPASFDQHELAHAYRRRASGGASMPLLEEGLAQALSCRPSSEFHSSTGRLRECLEEPDSSCAALLPGSARTRRSSTDWRDWYTPTGALGYMLAGAFVTELARRYGWQSVTELLHRVPWGATVHEFEREFAQVYPMSVDDAWNGVLDRQGAPVCFRDWPCTGVSWTGDLTPNCSDEATHRLFSLHGEGAVTLSVQGPVRLIDCAAIEKNAYWLYDIATEESPVTDWVMLPPSTYAITFPAFTPPQVPRPQSLGLRSYLAGPMLGDTCETAGTVQLNPESTTALQFGPGVLNGWIRLTNGGGRTYRIGAKNVVGNIIHCDGCNPDDRCVHHLGNGQVFKDNAFLQMQNVQASQPSEGDYMPFVDVSFQPHIYPPP